jgi:carbon monoxide dehydrogenase subunit G
MKRMKRLTGSDEPELVVGYSEWSTSLQVAYDGTARIVKSDPSSRTTNIDLEGTSDIWGGVCAHMKMAVSPAERGSSLHTSVWLAMSGRTTLLGPQLLQRVAEEVFTRTGDRIKSRLEDYALTRLPDAADLSMAARTSWRRAASAKTGTV